VAILKDVDLDIDTQKYFNNTPQLIAKIIKTVVGIILKG